MTANSINYSEELLRAEYHKREPIRRALQMVMQKYDVQDWDIVELGSGLGHNLTIFSEKNRVTGIEGLKEAAEEASTRGTPTISADLHGKIPFESGSFDLVLCLDVLEHLVDPAHCLAEAHRILREDGILVINVPNHFSLSGRLNITLGSGIDSIKFFPQFDDWENPHLRFFRHSSITKLVQECQFKIDADWSRFFPSIPLANKVPRLTNSRFGQSLAKWTPELFAGGFFLISRRLGGEGK
jgi:SAM-dependent methyltransferase